MITEQDLQDVRERLDQLEKSKRVDPPSPAKVSTRDKQCGGCLFFENAKCHRFPPYSGPDEDNFPTVTRYDWCGEWKPNK